MQLNKRLEIRRWQRPSNYIGADYNNYIVAATRSRYCNTLENANFEAMLQLLGKHHTIIKAASHWASGWVEMLLVADTATKTLEKLDKALRDLEEYPVLDEDTYTSLEEEKTLDLITTLQGDAARLLANYLSNSRDVDDDLYVLGEEIVRAAAAECGVDDVVLEYGVHALLTREYHIRNLEDSFPNNPWVQAVRAFFEGTK